MPMNVACFSIVCVTAPVSRSTTCSPCVFHPLRTRIRRLPSGASAIESGKLPTLIARPAASRRAPVGSWPAAAPTASSSSKTNQVRDLDEKLAMIILQFCGERIRIRIIRVVSKVHRRARIEKIGDQKIGGEDYPHRERPRKLIGDLRPQRAVCERLFQRGVDEVVLPRP